MPPRPTSSNLENRRPPLHLCDLSKTTTRSALTVDLAAQGSLRVASGWLRGAYRLATRWPEGGLGVAVTRVRPFKVQGSRFRDQSSRFEVQGSPCTRQRLTVAGSEQSFSTNQDRVAGLTIPAELIGSEPFLGSAGEFGSGTPVRGVSRTRERV